MRIFLAALLITIGSNPRAIADQSCLGATNPEEWIKVHFAPWEYIFPRELALHIARHATSWDGKGSFHLENVGSEVGTGQLTLGVPGADRTLALTIEERFGEPLVKRAEARQKISVTSTRIVSGGQVFKMLRFVTDDLKEANSVFGNATFWSGIPDQEF